MKKFISKLVAGAAALCFALSAAACNTSANGANSGGNGGGNSSTGYAYVAIDINPSIELVVKDGVVTGVKACNEDASVLLNGETVVGLTVEAASNLIVALAEELGYLTDANNDVKITVVSDDTALAETVEKKAQDGAKKGSLKAAINHNPRAEDERKVKELQEENPELYKDLTPQKLRMIEAIMVYDTTMTYEKGAAMKVSELADLLDDLFDDFKDVVGDELEGRFEDRMKELRAEADRKLAELYGEDYLAKWEKYNALLASYRAIEFTAETVAISEEDVASILTLLGMGDASQFIADGKITVEEIENYIDRKFDKDRFDKFFNGELFDELEEAIEMILDKYDEENYVLTTEDLAALSAAYGETLSFADLEEVEEFLETLEEELEELKKSITLTEEQKAELKKYADELSGMAHKVHDEMKNELEKARDEFRQIKENRRK
ncbi:MAG: hypothetical protein IJY62_01585 [Clostridia bacterium]|nr:hypothetical protein [Clostridia bacterium]